MATTCSVAQLAKARNDGLESIPSPPTHRVRRIRTASGLAPAHRCSARSMPGLPAGWSGKPRKASPRTLGSGAVRLRLRGHSSAERPSAREQRQVRRQPRRLGRPPRAPPHARSSADRPASSPSPCTEIGSAASQSRAPPALAHSTPSPCGSSPRPRRARRRKAPCASAGRISSAETLSSPTGMRSASIRPPRPWPPRPTARSARARPRRRAGNRPRPIPRPGCRASTRRSPARCGG